MDSAFGLISMVMTSLGSANENGISRAHFRDALSIATPSALAASESAVPPDAEIRKILADRIDTRHQSVGIVVGVDEPHGRRIIAYGERDSGDPRILDVNTLCQHGSMTQV